MASPVLHQSSVRNGLLAALAPEDWARLGPHLKAVELPFDQTVHAAGDPLDAVLFPECGMVSLIVTLEGGDQVEAGIAGPEGLVGLPLVHGDDRALHEAKVQLEGTALRIGAAPFKAEMDRSASLRGLMLRYALAFQAQLALAAACNARHPVERRLARWMLTAHDRAGVDEFPMTHEFMSLMLGVRRPGVTVAAGTLQRSGLIRYARGRVAVADRPGLEAASCECYRTVRGEFVRLLGPFPAKPSP